jgi:hypothetical protein
MGRHVFLQRVSKSDPQLRAWMADHYSKPGGFVGRQLIYKVWFGKTAYGAIVAGSATKHLPGRKSVLGDLPLNNIVNNTFFHIEPAGGQYPFRNFTTHVVRAWREAVEFQWRTHYGDEVLGWETLVELPRTGELYLRDGWTHVGETKGFTCKRTAGKGTDSWGGKRVWDTKHLRPKRVFVRTLSV